MTIDHSPFTISAFAMATGFEIVIYGDDHSRLRAAADEAIAEIERLDRQLSFYSTSSDIFEINRYAAQKPIKVDPRLFNILKLCADISEKTGGAFDVTIGPLMRAWGFTTGSGHLPNPDELEEAASMTGMSHLLFNENDFTISFDRSGIEIDLGAVGKGYAVERASDILREAGITSALIHGGTSTIYAIGEPIELPTSNVQLPALNTEGWRVAVRNPKDENESLTTIDLKDNSLSVSAVHGKSFRDGQKELGHIIDPRTVSPVEGALLAAVVGPSPTLTDALSTALLVLGEKGFDLLTRNFPNYKCLILTSTLEKLSLGF